MGCPTCDHTMSCIWPGPPGSIFWCPRCGHLKDTAIGGEGESPNLVHRVTEFAGRLTDDHQDLMDEFERLGIRESIMVDSHASDHRLKCTGSKKYANECSGASSLLSAINAAEAEWSAERGKCSMCAAGQIPSNAGKHRSEGYESDCPNVTEPCGLCHGCLPPGEVCRGCNRMNPFQYQC